MSPDLTAAASLVVARLSIEREKLVGALFIALGSVGLAIAAFVLAMSASIALPALIGLGVGAVLIVHGILRRSAAGRADAALRALE